MFRQRTDNRYQLTYAPLLLVCSVGMLMPPYSPARASTIAEAVAVTRSRHTILGVTKLCRGRRAGRLRWAPLISRRTLRG